ncbi:MAG TPA: AMP-binding protein [Acidimicrobiales bacterium]|nr:AMP-binding protein [Acidimicrobiales bacterium]
MPGGSSSLPSIGSSLLTIGKSGLLRPYTPAQAARVVGRLPSLTPNAGGLLALAAARDPRGTAAVDDVGLASFSEMDERAAAVAAGLSRLGVEAGRTVALLCRNHRGFLLATAAAARLGADVLYLNTGFAGPQLAEVLTDEGVAALVVDEEFLDLTHGLDAGLPVVVAWWDDRRRVGDRTSLQQLLECDPAWAPPPSRRSGRSVLLTSGTTGRPKGASRDAPRDPTPVLGVLARIPYRRGDVTVLTAPMFHAWGLANTVVGLAYGATLVLSRRFDPEDTLRRIERYRARVLVAVPVMLQRIMELPTEVRAGYDTSSLQVVALSGSALPGELALRSMDAFGDVVYNLYGSTEVGWVSVAGPRDLRAAPSTAGRVLPGIRVRILDAEGSEVAPGATGRIFVRSALTFEGYRGGGGKEVLDGFMSTGDVGHVDDAGLLFVDGRDDDMIVSGGENVFPAEVEDLIAGHPAVAEVSVVGVPDVDFGQRLEAWVVVRPGATITAEEVVALVRANLARFKVPRRVHFVDALPRNAAGKVVKGRLAGDVAAG